MQRKRDLPSLAQIVRSMPSSSYEHVRMECERLGVRYVHATAVTYRSRLKAGKTPGGRSRAIDDEVAPFPEGTKKELMLRRLMRAHGFARVVELLLEEFGKAYQGALLRDLATVLDVRVDFGSPFAEGDLSRDR